ncbi:MAG: hypothetical protein ACJ78Q_13350 [Chloroflexia bacterium]
MQARAELYDRDEQSRQLFMYLLGLYGLEPYHRESNVVKEGKPIDYHEDLTLRLKAGLLVPKEEIQTVADELQALIDTIGPGHEFTKDEDSRADVLLNVIGNAGDSSYAPLVERLIRPPWEEQAHDTIVWYALLVLYSKWQIPARQYVGELPRIIANMGGMAGEIAAKIAVDYLRSNPDKRLLRDLIEIVENRKIHPVSRYEAYKALYRLVFDGGGPSEDEDEFWERTKYGRIDLLEVVDPTVLQKAKLGLRGEEET